MEAIADCARLVTSLVVGTVRSIQEEKRTGCKRVVSFVTLVVWLAFSMVAFAPVAADAQGTCPKLSQASLDLDTPGCSTTFNPIGVNAAGTLTSTGQVVLTNSGGFSAFLESVVVNLQKEQLVGNKLKFVTKASAVAV